jgi:hypothetical protein
MLIMANGGKENVNMYAILIERYLKNEDTSHSESEIAKEALSVALDTHDDIPSSTNDLDKLIDVRESLRMLLSQGKIFQILIQDPLTKEETAYYGFRKDRK